MARCVAAFTTGPACSAICASQLCFCHGWFVVPLPLLRRVVCLHTLTWVVCPVSVPSHLDHSYAVHESVYFLGAVQRPTHSACLGNSSLCHGTQPSRRRELNRLPVLHTGAQQQPPYRAG